VILYNYDFSFGLVLGYKKIRENPDFHELEIGVYCVNMLLEITIFWISDVPS